MKATAMHLLESVAHELDSHAGTGSTTAAVLGAMAANQRGLQAVMIVAEERFRSVVAQLHRSLQRDGSDGDFNTVALQGLVGGALRGVHRRAALVFDNHALSVILHRALQTMKDDDASIRRLTSALGDSEQARTRMQRTIMDLNSDASSLRVGLRLLTTRATTLVEALLHDPQGDDAREALESLRKTLDGQSRLHSEA